MSPTSPSPRDAYHDLERRFERMSQLRFSETFLEWDAATYMPDGGAGARGDQVATLRVIRHELLTAPTLDDLLARAAEADDLDGWERANLREMRRERAHAMAVPIALVEARSKASSACEMKWRSARQEDDFAGLLPLFEEVLGLTREVAAARSEKLGISPYDALLDEWEPGGRAAEIDAIFASLEAFLPPLVDRVIEAQARRSTASPAGPFPAERQTALALRVMRALGFDFGRGRVDLSAHPFCNGAPDDTRITTRWDEGDFTSGLFSVIHETGHALYEQALPARFRLQPVGQARGMSTHESQSLLFEMQAARSPELVGWLASVAREVFGGEGDLWSAEALLRQVQRVERSLIRVEADEVTYPLHVALRYRLERAMIAGDLALRDLPGAFADGMQRLLGVRPPNHRDGSLQDIHWPSGTFGYFPTYTLGALTAAQLYAAALEQVPAIPAGLAQGDTGPLRGWLGEQVHALGSSISPGEIIARATGAPLDPEVFRRHLERRYLG